MIEWKDYQAVQTVELIELIKRKQEPGNLEIAKAAFTAFCFRFQQRITKKAEIISKNNGFDKEFAIEIIERTFQRFWKYPGFKSEKMKVSSPDKGVELYLLRIAKNCFYDLVNERNGVNVSPYDGHEVIIYDIPEPEGQININSENFIILKKVFDTFTWKHRAIYLTYLQYENAGYKLPRKLLSELREKLKISQTTIRSYRFEVVNKIKEYKELWHQKK
jgi:hypothetical protein